MPRQQAPTGPQGRRMAVLCNPRSGRVLKQLEVVRGIGRELGGELYREASVPTEINTALRELTLEADTLCIIGGDGTVHGVLTALHALSPQGPWPMIAPAPAGSTNMTAHDLGAGGPLIARLLAIRNWRDRRGPGGEDRGGAVVQRPILCVEHSGQEAHCGMFFGAGAVADGVQFFDRKLRSVGLGEHTSGLSIARVLLSLAVHGIRGDSIGCSMRGAIDGRPTAEYVSIFCLASTLHRLVLGTRPYWGEEDAPLHFTLIEKSARAFWRSLPRIARGRPGTRLTPERGYLSQNATAVELTFDGPFAMDGEIYQARADDGPCRITTPRVVDWLVP